MRAIGLLLAAVLCCGSVDAQVPHQINYQGYLTAAGGAPVNATVSMVLKLYTVSTGGSALYTETQSIAVTNGVFNVNVGSVTPLPLPFDVPYWLGVTVGADAEMTPRPPLAASAYAIRSATTEALAATATVPGSQITGTVGSATNFSGMLGGDVTGTQAATVVGAVGGASAANVALGATAANAATSANTPSTIVRRDASGNFSVGTITGSLSGNATSATTATTATTAGNVTGIVALAHGGTSSATQNFVDLSTNQSAIAGDKTFTGAHKVSTAFTVEARPNNTGVNNLFIGASAGLANTTANFNIGVGTFALTTNTLGAQNTAIGNFALFQNVTGDSNTAAGAAALQFNKG